MSTTEEKNAQLRSSQTLIMIAFISAPVSIMIGGVLLSSVALICSIIAYRKIRNVIGPEDTKGTVGYSLASQSRIALILSIVTLVLNAIAFIYLFGVLMEVMQDGDYSKLTELMTRSGGLYGGEGSSGAAPSVWD